MATLINEYLYAERLNVTDELPEDEPEVVVKPRMCGLDFSGSKKMSYLHAARLLIEAKLFVWPKQITGIRSQLTNYDPEKDRGFTSKIAQDIVAALAMSGHAIRTWFHVDPKELLAEVSPLAEGTHKGPRRKTHSGRAKRSVRARPKVDKPY